MAESYPQSKPRGRIPLHRSVIFVDYHARRIIGWVLAALLVSLLVAAFHEYLLGGFAGGVDLGLRIGGIAFDQGAGDRMAGLLIPTWQVDTFNPVAAPAGALIYGVCALLGMLLVWRIPGLPLPLSSWLSLACGVLLLATLVLYWRPLPLLTPESFSALWGKITFGTLLVFPWIWALLVGLLPLPVGRTALWGGVAWICIGLWSILRLAFFLALSQWAGVVWLPLALIFGGTLMDSLVLIVCFGFTLEPAGREWGA